MSTKSSNAYLAIAGYEASTSPAFDTIFLKLIYAKPPAAPASGQSLAQALFILPQPLAEQLILDLEKSLQQLKKHSENLSNSPEDLH